jgi:DNA-binding MarR family transcriptional regulator
MRAGVPNRASSTQLTGCHQPSRCSVPESRDAIPTREGEDGQDDRKGGVMAGRRQYPMRIICRMNPDLRQLHLALMDLVGILNRPQPGLVLLREAGISLDRALFQLLVRIERRGPIGIVDLAERSGRDYTTVSRQVNKLESMGLVSRRTGTVDRRTREVVPTRAGLAMTGEVDRARDKLMTAIFAKWSSRDLRELARLCQRFTDTIAGVRPSDQPDTQEPRRSSGDAARSTTSGGQSITKAKSLNPASRRPKTSPRR